MANLYTPPIGARVISSFAPGDLIDVVNRPSGAVSIQTFTLDPDTLYVMPFYSDYVLNYDALNISYNANANVTWGLYSYEPSSRSGSLVSATGGVTLNGTTSSVLNLTPASTIYSGRTYAVAVNSSTNWTMDVFFSGGAGCSRILGLDWVGVSPRVWTHLRGSLAYNATLPATLPSGLVKNNSLSPPTPLIRSV
jgi:hypothetical protein